MTHVTGRLTAKNRDQLRNPTPGSRVWLCSVPAGLRRLVAAVQRSRRQNSTADCRHPGVAAVRTRASLGVELCSRPAATTEVATSPAVYIRAYVHTEQKCYGLHRRRLYIPCWRELSRRRLLPAVSPAAGHLTTPTVAGLPGLCENCRPTTSTTSPI